MLARAASALNHPNIITIYEIDQSDSVNFIATEFIDGQTLRERCALVAEAWRGTGCLSAGGALAAAHEVGIVHRDIKPENLSSSRWDCEGVGLWACKTD